MRSCFLLLVVYGSVFKNSNLVAFGVFRFPPFQPSFGLALFVWGLLFPSGSINPLVLPFHLPHLKDHFLVLTWPPAGGFGVGREGR